MFHIYLRGIAVGHFIASAVCSENNNVCMFGNLLYMSFECSCSLRSVPFLVFLVPSHTRILMHYSSFTREKIAPDWPVLDPGFFTQSPTSYPFVTRFLEC